MLLASLTLGADVPLFSGESFIALIALTVMEIILGIDNIVFIAIITGRLPADKRSFARRFGLFLAMGMRILLLFMIGAIVKLTSDLFRFSDWIPIESLAQHLAEDPEMDGVSTRDLILFFGGLFLLYTAVREIHHKVEGGDDDESETEQLDGVDGNADGISPVALAKKQVTTGGVLTRIALMDVIFSLDSVITAVGMANHIEIMIAAVVISVAVMIIFANQISDFVQEHPTVKILALSFLILIGVVLVSESAGTPINKGYVYFAMAFSLMVEFLNLRMHMKRVRPSPGEGETGSIS